MRAEDEAANAGDPSMSPWVVPKPSLLSRLRSTFRWIPDAIFLLIVLLDAASGSAAFFNGGAGPLRPSTKVLLRTLRRGRPVELQCWWTREGLVAEPVTIVLAADKAVLLRGPSEDQIPLQSFELLELLPRGERPRGSLGLKRKQWAKLFDEHGDVRYLATYREQFPLIAAYARWPKPPASLG